MYRILETEADVVWQHHAYNNKYFSHTYYGYWYIFMKVALIPFGVDPGHIAKLRDGRYNLLQYQLSTTITNSV